MADHGTVEYATATGNDYPAHEQTYETFVKFAFVGTILIGASAQKLNFNPYELLLWTRLRGSGALGRTME